MKREVLTTLGDLPEFEARGLLGVCSQKAVRVRSSDEVVNVDPDYFLTLVDGGLKDFFDEVLVEVPPPIKFKFERPGECIRIQNRMRNGFLLVNYPDGASRLDAGETLELVALDGHMWLVAA